MKTRPFLYFTLCLTYSFLQPVLLHSRTSSVSKPKTEKNTGYDKQWKQVDSLSNAGLPKSAIEIVDRIYFLSKMENNKPQYIKSLIYRFKLQSDFQEDILVSTIRDLKSE